MQPSWESPPDGSNPAIDGAMNVIQGNQDCRFGASEDSSSQTLSETAKTRPRGAFGRIWLDNEVQGRFQALTGKAYIFLWVMQDEMLIITKVFNWNALPAAWGPIDQFDYS